MNTSAHDSDKSRTPEWLRRKERGNLFWIGVMSRLSLLLGRRLSRIVLYGVVFYFLAAAAQARRASRTYLGRMLQHRPTWRDLYRHMLAFSTTVHDRIYLLNDRHDLFETRILGAERLHALHEAGKGCLLFGAHLGSFEILRSVARENGGLKVSAAMFPENARQLNETLAAINPEVMLDVIALGRVDAMLTIHQKLQEGALVGILADRASGPDTYLPLPFLGAPAHFPSGPFRLATMLRQPVFFMAGLYRGGNRYDIKFELLEDFSQPSTGGREEQIRVLMGKYVAALERQCRAAPFNWFNFYDFWGPAGREDH